MSCQIKISANIIDIPKIRRCLYPTDDLRGSDNWLQNSLISVSPTGELIVIAKDHKIVALSAKWDSNAVLSQFHISYSGILDNQTDPITAVLCLPIVSQGQSSQVGPDWTCIVVGFQSGYVKFYTDNCTLLLAEQLHNDRVCSIKCQSQYCSHLDISSDIRPEEVYVQYPSNVCVLAGAQLFSALRNCRSQLARVQAAGSNFELTTSVLCPKKWGFTDQATVNDAVVVGLDAANTFNHLLTASTCGGFETRYRAMAPNNTLVLGAGVRPYVGFHFASEGGSQPILNDVAKAVANKLKSALPGWLVGSSKSSFEKQPSIAIQPAEAMGCRFGLCDLRRNAESIINSPDKKLSIVTDSMGRISLIDNHKGITVRLWKGYRGAQCSFLQVPDEDKSKHSKANPKKNRIALFLAIYTPKKGIIEIWAMQQGPKIVTFSASKNSRLMYVNYGLMGFGATVSKIKNIYHFTCLLIDPDGQIKEILVPFHFALAEKNSKRARDLHLFKRLKQFLKSEDYNLDKLCSEVLATCSELKTNEIRLQCFEMVTGSKHVLPKAALLLSECFIDKLNGHESPDLESKRLINLCINLKTVVTFYIYMENEDMDAENGNVSNNNSGESQLVDTKLMIGEKEMHNLQRLLDLTTLKNVNNSVEFKVSFHEESKSIFTEYLSIFDLNSEQNNIMLKKDISEEKLYHTSEKIFIEFIMSKRNDYDVFHEEVTKSCIRTLDLVKMVLNYWINRPLDININLEKEMHNLSQILRVICSTNSLENICVDYNKESPFWTEVREYLANAPKPFPALTAAILCRGIAQRLEQEKESQQCSATSLEEEVNTDIWEKLSQENCQWTLLIGKLEDISLLNIILSNSPVVERSTLPKLMYDRAVVSLKYILQRGRGSVSELVAQWLTSAGIEPECILLLGMNVTEEADKDTSSRPQSLELNIASNHIIENKDNFDLNQPAFEHFNILRKQFPYSLNSSAIIANMCWEYALAWQKYIQNFNYLIVMLTCLTTIPNPHIKQGMFNLVWTTHLRQTFESTCKLINKVGKVPKEFLCRQDTGLSDTQLSLYIDLCTNFLDSFIDAVQQTYGTSKPVLSFENLWENGGVPLTELALQQNEINNDLLFIHYQLSLVIQTMTVFNIKLWKAIPKLFDSSTINLFFTDLSQKVQVSTHSSSSKLITARVKFLTKVIDASIETVTVVENNTYASDHVNWMSKCIVLASIWGIDTDLLRRHQIVQLYTSGFPDLADELLPSVSDVENIGPQLLDVAGKQLKQILRTSKDLTGNVTALSPSLLTYLESLDGEWCAPGTLDSVKNLAEHATRCLPDEHALSKYTVLLLDGCTTLQEMEK